MKKSKYHIQYIDSGIFPATIMFIVGYSYKEVLCHLKKTKAEEWHCGIQGHEKLFNGKSFAIRTDIINAKGKEKTLFYIGFNDLFKFTDFDYIALAHECLHICQYFLPDALDRNKEHEAEAYLHSHLMKQCLEILRR